MVKNRTENDESDNKYWSQNGKWHRDGGPALEFANGDKYWYQNGKFHRDDGPAVESTSGYKAWYLEGKKLSEAEFNTRMNSAPRKGKSGKIERKSTL